MKLTPAMQQYYDLKEQYQDAILFFRMGDFYEMFAEDANIAHRVLGIAVTSRNKNAAEPIPLAGIPYHAKEKYLPMLVWAGYKVAIAEQVSDPKLKWIVKREVVRVVTPATLDLEGEWYGNVETSNYLVSVIYENDIYGLSFLDITTNAWICSEFTDFDRLASEVYKISPWEVILSKSLFDNEKVKEIFSKKYSLNIYFFEMNLKPSETLRQHFGVKNLEWYWIEKKSWAQKAAAQVIEYLKVNQKSDLSFLDSLSYESFSSFLDLDETTIRSLDLIYNMSTKSSKLGTLFWILDDTKTSMGTRYLRDQILYPLQDIKEIKKRQDYIEEFYKNPVLLDKVQNKLKGVSDIDAILNRLALWRAGVKDLTHLKKSLQAIQEVMNLIESDGSKKLQSIFSNIN